MVFLYIHFSILSHMFECSIVLLDAGRPEHIVCFTGSNKGTAQPMNQGKLRRFMKAATENDEPVAVVEGNGQYGLAGHFSAYASADKCRPENPIWLKAALSPK